MSSQLLIIAHPHGHAGQRRFHDYAKLRELYQKRLLASLTVPRKSSISSSSNLSHFQTYPNGRFGTTTHSARAFTSTSVVSSSNNPFHRALNNLQLKRLERDANAAPHDADAQYQFVRALANDHPTAVLARIQSPQFRHCAVNVPLAILYLQILQQTGQVNQLDVAILLQRLQRNSVNEGLTPEVLQEFHNELAAQKLSKADQAQQLLNILLSTTTGAGAAAGLGAVTTGMTGRWGAASGALMSGTGAAVPLMHRGLDPKNPLHVQLIPAAGPAGGARGFFLRLLARGALIMVGISAVGALLDERGLGRGMGMNSNSKHVQEAEVNGRKVKFEDVKGVSEAKAELEEIVMYLKDPSKFTRLGGKLPRGVLLTGPPGTGKTLLAKAIAGEADVPFFFASGSQFEEVYVGLGAKRVRELFEAAKKKAPAIIFIDEIDAVGGTRKLKDQSALKMTLNELLVQLDGFDENNGIIVIGATNFKDSLDEALLRPGRFDKHVVVPLPDVGGRKEILEMYAKKTKLAKDVDLNILARGTTGMSGADLFNLMNQAALKASVDGLNAITMQVLEYAKDKIIMGAERKSAVITAETARCTAYHEAGHALVAVLTDGAQTIHKATIMPRGNALGLVATLPEGDQTSQSYKEMLATMDMAMGGRVAEELVFGKDEVTSGAMSDIQYATRIARHMVTKCGFSEAVGIVFHGGNTGEESASAETRALIDAEVKKLTDAAHKRARDLLTKYSYEHKLLAETLLEYETLTGDEVRDVVLKRQKPKRPVINKNGGSRGDTSILSSGRQGSKTTTIPGMGKTRA